MRMMMHDGNAQKLQDASRCPRLHTSVGVCGRKIFGVSHCFFLLSSTLAYRAEVHIDALHLAQCWQTSAVAGR